DLLVIPKPAWDQSPAEYIHAALLADVPPDTVRALEAYVDGVGASWCEVVAPSAGTTREVDDTELDAAWTRARDAARRPRLGPRSVTAAAKTERVVLRVDDADVEAPPPRPLRIGRFGPLFGDVVHH